MVIEVYFDDLTITHIKSPIIQSDDYYPFGLTFNSYSRENSVPNRWKFQGQEHVDDLGLNWDAFKWRNHQPDIGRFFCIDPLSEKYVYYSPYAFSGNRVINARELEGLEPLVLFGSKDEAAKNYGHFYNDNSIRKKQEYGSTIYSKTVGGKQKFGYSIANIGTSGFSVKPSSAPAGTKPEAMVHTHANFDAKFLNNIFSGIPKSGALSTSTPALVGVLHQQVVGRSPIFPTELNPSSCNE